MKGAIISTLIAISMANITWITVWAYEIDNKMEYTLSKLELLITPDGDIRPSTKVEVMEEKLRHIEECRRE